MLNIEVRLDKVYQERSNGKNCYFCKRPATAIHHLIRRSEKQYRWDSYNALPICWDCHNDLHHTKDKGGLVEPIIEMEYKSIKDYLKAIGKSYNEFLELKRDQYFLKPMKSDFLEVKKAVVKESFTVQKPVVSKKEISESQLAYKEEQRKKVNEYNHNEYLRKKAIIKNSKKK